ncbi:gastrula zinc finger protein XlCGF57.1-like [Polypterus senegalus]|uniref:gastrula zinc finger protein XlCGF57.1-like n=1 Tax=Polypterus senegalus TaxID=55291 RepID=UPI0019656ADF|nr:gastrula zinc finger protein XlCGF57.1-like [Polypterus senegalus]
MEVKEETCDRNIMEIMNVTIKEEVDYEWEAVQSKQDSPNVMNEDYELVTLGIKEETEEMSVSIETHKYKSVETVDLKVRCESLPSDTKRIVEIRTRNDQPSPTHWSEQSLQESVPSFPQISLQCRPQLTERHENSKMLKSGSEILTPNSLQQSSLPSVKLTRTDERSTQQQMHNTNLSELSVLQEPRKKLKQKSKDNGKKDSCTKKKPYCCSECGKQFSAHSSLQIHIRTHTGEKPYCCTECGKEFSQICNLQRHTRIHTGEKPYFCTECGKRFTTSSDLHIHTIVHTGEKPYCCSECGKQFSKNADLQIHTRIHIGEKPYCCSECGKQFSQMGTLKRHTKIHTGQKPYCCFECGKEFSTSGNLQRHTRTHTGHRPYCCTECGNLFLQVDHLKIHARIHTGEKPYCCAECGQRFINSSSLQTHSRIHTGEKPYCCSECGKRFTTRGNLNQHIRNHTKEKS